MIGLAIRLALSAAVISGGVAFAKQGFDRLDELVGGSGSSKSAQLAAVTDGDTISIRRRGETISVRLIGIDTPETKRPGVGVECGGPEASASMADLIEVGDKVELRTDPSQDQKDRYGRLLRYVEADGRDVGQAQLRRGHAEVYVFDSDYKRLGRYEGASRRAERAGNGVWGRCGGNFHSGG